MTALPSDRSAAGQPLSFRQVVLRLHPQRGASPCLGREKALLLVSVSSQGSEASQILLFLHHANLLRQEILLALRRLFQNPITSYFHRPAAALAEPPPSRAGLPASSCPCQPVLNTGARASHPPFQMPELPLLPEQNPSPHRGLTAPCMQPE